MWCQRVVLARDATTCAHRQLVWQAVESARGPRWQASGEVEEGRAGSTSWLTGVGPRAVLVCASSAEPSACPARQADKPSERTQGQREEAPRNKRRGEEEKRPRGGGWEKRRGQGVEGRGRHAHVSVKSMILYLSTSHPVPFSSTLSLTHSLPLDLCVGMYVCGCVCTAAGLVVLQSTPVSVQQCRNCSPKPQRTTRAAQNDCRRV